MSQTEGLAGAGFTWAAPVRGALQAEAFPGLCFGLSLTFCSLGSLSSLVQFYHRNFIIVLTLSLMFSFSPTVTPPHGFG
jgi:hypothetical protein